MALTLAGYSLSLRESLMAVFYGKKSRNMHLFLSNIPVPVYPDTDDERFIVIVIVTMYCVKSCVHESFVRVWLLWLCSKCKQNTTLLQYIQKQPCRAVIKITIK